MLNGAAKHGPRLVERPEVFDITRTPVKHLALGHGIHLCLSAPPARNESREHIRDVQEVLPARSRARRLCGEILTDRHPPAALSVKPESISAALPTDEELSALADPAAAIADLLRD